MRISDGCAFVLLLCLLLALNAYGLPHPVFGQAVRKIPEPPPVSIINAVKLPSHPMEVYELGAMPTTLSVKRKQNTLGLPSRLSKVNTLGPRPNPLEASNKNNGDSEVGDWDSWRYGAKFGTWISAVVTGFGVLSAATDSFIHPLFIPPNLFAAIFYGVAWKNHTAWSTVYFTLLAGEFSALNVVVIGLLLCR